MEPTPILYEKPVKIRFSDIDRYQHVNTTFYPDYVFTSRFEFMKDRFGLSPNYFEKEVGVGFYTTRFELNFHRPIAASISSVLVKSKVISHDRSLVKIEYKISDDTGAVLFSSGTFDMMFIDLKTQKPLKEIPEELKKFIWE